MILFQMIFRDHISCRIIMSIRLYENEKAPGIGFSVEKGED